MKEMLKKITLVSILMGTTLLISCENESVKPDTFADGDPPTNSTPVKPPNP